MNVCFRKFIPHQFDKATRTEPAKAEAAPNRMSGVRLWNRPTSRNSAGRGAGAGGTTGMRVGEAVVVGVGGLGVEGGDGVGLVGVGPPPPPSRRRTASMTCTRPLLAGTSSVTRLA